MVRAIIWCAVSTKPQAQDDERYSLKSQEDDARALCERSGWQVVDVLSVPGHSRNYRSLDKCASDARAAGIDAFDKLIRHLADCDFDVLICRDANRFARKASLLHYIVESIIEDCGARIYSFSDGMVDATNADIFAMVKGYTTAKEMKWLRESSMRGKAKNLENGLPVGSKVLLSHQRVRDPRSGKTIGLIVNESLRTLFDDLAALLLEGVGWNTIGDALHARGGHVDKTGRPYSSATLYALVMSPMFWGHTFRNTTRRQMRGRWIFDDDCPPPEGVTVWRHTIPAVYAGEQAEDVKAELRRRMDMRGRTRPHDTYRFAGLFVCGECAGALVVYNKRGKRLGLRCRRAGSTLNSRRHACSQHGLVREDYLVDWWTDALDKLLRHILPDALKDERGEPEWMPALEHLRADIEQVERQIDTLIAEQANAPPSVQERYRQYLAALAARLDILRRRELEMRSAATRRARDEAAASVSLDEIRAITLEYFWQLPDRRINQILRRILGERRLVVLDKKIVGSSIPE